MAGKSKRDRRGVRVAGVVLGLVLLVGVAILLLRFGLSPDEMEEIADQQLEENEATDFVSPAIEREGDRAIVLPQAATTKMLTPMEVIDNPNCYMAMGKGAASDLALVVVPDGDSARFSVVNYEGTLHSGVLPFRPYHNMIGRRPDGTVVTGFGGIPLNPFQTALNASGEPLQVLANNEVLVDKENVWFFGVSSDGSSYFYIESLGSDYSSRLVVSNLDEGTERHFDLGQMFSMPDGNVPYLASYSVNGEEIHLRPVPGLFSEGIGSHYFFPTEGEGKMRQLHAQDSGRDDHVHFVSSEEAYFLYAGVQDAQKFQIVKNRYDWDNRKIIRVWQRQGPESMRPSFVETSPEGSWLLFGTGTSATHTGPAKESDSMLYVLDASTGENAFAFPKSSLEAQLRQLSSVLPLDATADDAGVFRGASFLGNDQLAIHRYLTKDGIFDQNDGVYDIFDLSKTALYGQPELRVSVNRHNSNLCASLSFPRKLQVGEGGRLEYGSFE